MALDYVNSQSNCQQRSRKCAICKRNNDKIDCVNCDVIMTIVIMIMIRIVTIKDA